MVFHGVPFESGFDDYDVVFRQAGFDQSVAVDFAGIRIDRQARAMKIDSRYQLVNAGKSARPRYVRDGPGVQECVIKCANANGHLV